jgi:hypothetical protein
MLVLGLLPILGSVPISVIVRPHFLQVGLSVSDMATQKNYAVGLEISRPAGACNWAPEIPRAEKDSPRQAEHA